MMYMDTPEQPGPLYQSFLDYFALHPPNPWPPASAEAYVFWLHGWATYAESVGLTVPLPLTTPQFDQ